MPDRPRASTVYLLQRFPAVALLGPPNVLTAADQFDARLRWSCYRNRDPEGCREVGLVENLTMATGQQEKKPPKGHEITHICNRSHISLEKRLQVGGEPKAASVHL